MSLLVVGFEFWFGGFEFWLSTCLHGSWFVLIDRLHVFSLWDLCGFASGRVDRSSLLKHRFKYMYIRRSVHLLHLVFEYNHFLFSYVDLCLFLCMRAICILHIENGIFLSKIHIENHFHPNILFIIRMYSTFDLWLLLTFCDGHLYMYISYFACIIADLFDFFFTCVICIYMCIMYIYA